MDYQKLFNQIKKSEYKKTGDEVDFCIQVNSKGKLIKLLFEESQSKRDWQNNFNFPVKIYKNQKSKLLAHRGFGNAYKSANDVIMNELEGYIKQFPDFNVLISGWSLGGAMAVLAAEDFYFRFHKKAMLITYGAPKVLFGKKCKCYVLGCCSSVIQFADNNDIVPLLPPFPGNKQVSLKHVGDKFSFKKIVKPQIYHCSYGDFELTE